MKTRDLPRVSVRVRALATAVALLATSILASARPAEALIAPELESYCGTNYGHLDWHEPAWGRIIEELQFKIHVGNDDIRSGTRVYATVRLASPSRAETLPWQELEQAGVSPGSWLEGKYFLPRSNIPVDRIKGVAILYTSGQPDPFSTPDNWDMTSLQILYSVDSTQRTLVFGEGSPWLHRFKVNCDGEGGPLLRADSPWNPN
jgi:hypothetical protein